MTFNTHKTFKKTVPEDRRSMIDECAECGGKYGLHRAPCSKGLGVVATQKRVAAEPPPPTSIARSKPVRPYVDQIAFWTPERLATLRRYWGNAPAFHIAFVLGTTVGSVIGQAHRQELAPIPKETIALWSHGARIARLLNEKG